MPEDWNYAICNGTDGPCFDYRINDAQDNDQRAWVVGSLLNGHDFNESLRRSALPEVVHHGGHRMVFTHGDLNRKNVLADEYWETG
jgi:hypothetical protein